MAIQLKRTNTASYTPVVGDFDASGQIILNTTDGKMFFMNDAEDAVFEVGTGSSGGSYPFAFTVNSSGSPVGWDTSGNHILSVTHNLGTTTPSVVLYDACGNGIVTPFLVKSDASGNVATLYLDPIWNASGTALVPPGTWSGSIIGGAQATVPPGWDASGTDGYAYGNVAGNGGMLPIRKPLGGEITSVGANITWSGLTSSTQRSYELEWEGQCNANENPIHLYVNGDTTDGNYTDGYFWAAPSGINYGPTGAPSIGHIVANYDSAGYARIRVSPSGYYNWSTATNFRLVLNAGLVLYYGYKNATIAQITSLTLSGLPAGSKARLFSSVV